MLWSQALANTALEYVNDYGPDADADETIFEIARNKYAYSICDYLVVDVTHDTNTKTDWDMADVPLNTMVDWLGDGKFDEDALGDGTMKQLGVACGCDATDNVRCIFIFTKNMVAREYTDSAPEFQDFTAAGSCSTLEDADSLFADTACEEDQYSDGTCVDCSSMIPHCDECSYDDTERYSVTCSSCESGYELDDVFSPFEFC